MAITYRIRFKQADVEFEVEGDRVYVTKTYGDLKDILGLQQGARPLPVTESKQEKRGVVAKPATVGGKSYSPREFIDRYGLKRHTDIVLGFGETRRLAAFQTPTCACLLTFSLPHNPL
jgi:hypothetical protein